jgi:hypothetical protein
MVVKGKEIPVKDMAWCPRCGKVYHLNDPAGRIGVNEKL